MRLPGELSQPRRLCYPGLVRLCAPWETFRNPKVASLCCCAVLGKKRNPEGCEIIRLIQANGCDLLRFLGGISQP